MKSAGVAAEDLALQFLESCGLTLITRNYRCRFGEIDLVLQDGDTTVFAEVRLRKSEDFGGAAGFDVIALGQLDRARVEWIKDAFGT
jgi:Holliday junction resolvase-like predicted endonuclease